MTNKLLPDFDDIVSASHQIADHVVHTPLIRNAALDEIVGGPVWIKPEPLQRTGSFKFRGAFNTISRLSKNQQSKGVVAFSSGNHAQGVAEAARLLGLTAKIVMPADAPEIKKLGVTSRGGDVISYDRVHDDREEVARQIAEAEGLSIIPPFEHPHIIAGQGTAGLEIFRDLEAFQAVADQLICCIGGGGLIAGIGLAASSLSPGTKIFGAEPVGFDDHVRSLKVGHRERNTQLTGSICDALMAVQPGEMTFALNRKQLSGVGVVSDDQVREAMRFAFEHLKIVVEPGGAAGLAALLSGQIKGEDQTSVVVLTGGNVDPVQFAEILTTA